MTLYVVKKNQLRIASVIMLLCIGLAQHSDLGCGIVTHYYLFVYHHDSVVNIGLSLSVWND